MPDDISLNGGALYQSALAYLARYASTEAGLRRVLQRRIDRWARAQPDADAAQPAVMAARAEIEVVVRRLTDAGVLSDAAFAESRARGLARSGLSKRSIEMRLMSKGVAREVARAASTADAETELAAALVLARKRRVGPYRVVEDVDLVMQTKEMGLLLRAGFSRDIAEQVLRMSREDAETQILELRR